MAHTMLHNANSMAVEEEEGSNFAPGMVGIILNTLEALQ